MDKPNSEIEPLSLFGFMIGVMAPAPCHLDAVLVHGAPIRSEKLDRGLLRAVVDVYEGRRVRQIVLNGLTEEECRSLNPAYVGYEPWEKELVRLGVDHADIVGMEPSRNTGVEAAAFLHLAKDQGWGRLGVASHPHHLPRCFLSMVAQMETVGFVPDVYCISGPAIGYDEELVKTALKDSGLPDVVGTLQQHLANEWISIDRYSGPPPMDELTGLPKYTRNATILEGLMYLHKRK